MLPDFYDLWRQVNVPVLNAPAGVLADAAIPALNQGFANLDRVFNPVEVPFSEFFRPSSWTPAGAEFDPLTAITRMTMPGQWGQLTPAAMQGPSQREDFIAGEMARIEVETGQPMNWEAELALRRHHTPLAGQLAATAPQFLIPGGQATALQSALGRAGARAAARGGIGGQVGSRAAGLGQQALTPFVAYDRGVDAVGRGINRGINATLPAVQQGYACQRTCSPVRYRRRLGWGAVARSA